MSTKKYPPEKRIFFRNNALMTKFIISYLDEAFLVEVLLLEEAVPAVLCEELLLLELFELQQEDDVEVEEQLQEP